MAARKRVGCPCGLAEEETRLVAMRRFFFAGIAYCHVLSVLTFAPFILSQFVVHAKPKSEDRASNRGPGRTFSEVAFTFEKRIQKEFFVAFG
jgi:hypothetical protein